MKNIENIPRTITINLIKTRKIIHYHWCAKLLTKTHLTIDILNTYNKRWDSRERYDLKRFHSATLLIIPLNPGTHLLK